MKIFRKKIPLSLLRELSTRDIARCCGVTERTARLWKERGAPETAARLLALAIGDLEAIAGPAWRYWELDGVGKLIGPDGTVWDIKHLSKWWIEQQQLDHFKALERRRADGIPMADPAELERLQQAVATAKQLSAELASLYPDTAERGQPGDHCRHMTRKLLID